MTTPSAPDPDALTPRERQVLQAMANGSSYAETAVALAISPETVRSHAKSLLLKLQARNRVHAVVIGLQAGLIFLPPSLS